MKLLIQKNAKDLVMLKKYERVTNSLQNKINYNINYHFRFYVLKLFCTIDKSQ